MYFYLHAFIRVSTNTIFYWVSSLSAQEKISLYEGLRENLERFGLEGAKV